MSQPTLMTNFFPAAGDPTLRGEFDCWHPDPRYGQNQPYASMTWQGGTLPAIKAEEGLPFVDLPAQLLHMMKHCWQKASAPSPGVSRGNVTIAKARRAMGPAVIIQRAKVAAANAPVPHVSPWQYKHESITKMPHLQDVANDWKTHEQLERISAYTFRGDGRAPAAIKAADGFNPPNTRADAYYVDNVIFPQFQSYMERRYGVPVDKATFDNVRREKPTSKDEEKVLLNYFVWRALTDNEAYHLGRMLANQALKGYISTTRSTLIARGFTDEGGWVYLTLVRGGFVIPDKGKMEWTKIFGEQEIALPGPVKWPDVFGFRQVSNDKARNLVGPVYLRKGFRGRNAAAFTQAHDLLSGKPQ